MKKCNTCYGAGMLIDEDNPQKSAPCCPDCDGTGVATKIDPDTVKQEVPENVDPLAKLKEMLGI